MSRTTKTYKLNEDYAIKCITDINYFGEKKYSIIVVVDSLSWEEEMESVVNLTDSDEANRVFLELVNKYKHKRLFDVFIT